MIRIVSWCRDRNITCVFLTQPNGYHDVAGEEYKKGFWMTPQDSSYTLDFTSMIHIADLYNHYLKDFGDREKVPVFDLSGGIPGSYDYMYDDCHFNINGALQVSRLLSDYLRPFIKDILQNKIPPEK
jgi:lysophospholipase L1-like esterase